MLFNRVHRLFPSGLLLRKIFQAMCTERIGISLFPKPRPTTNSLPVTFFPRTRETCSLSPQNLSTPVGVWYPYGIYSLLKVVGQGRKSSQYLAMLQNLLQGSWAEFHAQLYPAQMKLDRIQRFNGRRIFSYWGKQSNGRQKC